MQYNMWLKSQNCAKNGLPFNPRLHVNETQITRWIMLILLVIKEYLNTRKCQFVTTENGRRLTSTLKISSQFDFPVVLCQQVMSIYYKSTSVT